LRWKLGEGTGKKDAPTWPKGMSGRRESDREKGTESKPSSRFKKIWEGNGTGLVAQKARINDISSEGKERSGGGKAWGEYFL